MASIQKPERLRQWISESPKSILPLWKALKKFARKEMLPLAVGVG